MKKSEIEKQAERITSLFSYRAGYSTPKDAYIEGARWMIAHISDWIEERAKKPAPEHVGQFDFDEGFLRGLNAVNTYLNIDD